MNSPTREAIEAGVREPHVARCVALGAPRAVWLETCQYGSLPMFQLLNLLHELLDILGVLAYEAPREPEGSLPREPERNELLEQSCLVPLIS